MLLALNTLLGSGFNYNQKLFIKIFVIFYRIENLIQIKWHKNK